MYILPAVGVTLFVLLFALAVVGLIRDQRVLAYPLIGYICLLILVGLITLWIWALS